MHVHLFAQIFFCMVQYNSYIKMFSNFKQFRNCKSSDDDERLQSTAGFVEGGASSFELCL